MRQAPFSLRLVLGAAVVAVGFMPIGAIAGLDGRTMAAVVLVMVSAGAIASGAVLVADLRGARRDYELWVRERKAALRVTAGAAGIYQVTAGVLLIAYAVAMLTVFR